MNTFLLNLKQTVTSITNKYFTKSTSLNDHPYDSQTQYQVASATGYIHLEKFEQHKLVVAQIPSKPQEQDNYRQ